jgi:hypothetical protein
VADAPEQRGAEETIDLLDDDDDAPAAQRAAAAAAAVAAPAAAGITASCPVCGARIRLGAGETASSARGTAAVNAHVDSCLESAKRGRGAAAAAAAVAGAASATRAR